MKLILFKSDPILTAYSTLGNITSVLNNRVDLEPWLYNNFVQLSAGNLFRFAYQKLMYHDSPFINTFSVPMYLINDIITFIESSIQNNMYLFFLVDRYYLSGYTEYCTKNQIHEIFVYGYDSEKQLLYTSDNSNSFKYANKLISYSNMFEAYSAVESNFMNLSQICTCNPPLIDIDKIKSSVSDYINSKINYDDIRYSNKNAYGISVYTKYIDILKLSGSLLNDFIPLHLFWEHKILMHKRIEYLINHGYLSCQNSLLDEYSTIAQKFLFLRNLLIRYSIRRDEGEKIQIITELPYYVNEETQLLREIFKPQA